MNKMYVKESPCQHILSTYNTNKCIENLEGREKTTRETVEVKAFELGFKRLWL